MNRFVNLRRKHTSYFLLGSPKITLLKRGDKLVLNNPLRFATGKYLNIQSYKIKKLSKKTAFF